MEDWKANLGQYARKQGMEVSPTPETPAQMQGKSRKVPPHFTEIKPGRKARAPYNFIPLNETVVPAEPMGSNDQYHENRHTGYIECHMKALTPLYIRDSLNESQVEARQEAKNNSDFFSPGGHFSHIRIPGSSLRGMIRTLVEIVSWSKFQCFEDRGLYYRGLADKSNLRNEYQKYMVNRNDYYYPKIQAGFLQQKGFKYTITPSKRDAQDTQIYRVDFKTVNGMGIVVDNFDFEVIYFKQVKPDDHTHYRLDRETGEKVPYKLRYALIESVSTKVETGNSEKGYLISSGPFGKKHMHWIINEPGPKKETIIIADVDIEYYRKDGDRKSPDLLEKVGSSPNGVPCFYVEWGDSKENKRVSFGHTGMFRLAYHQSIGDLVPSFLTDEDKIDMTEALFGKAAEKGKDSFAGRVFFEDAELTDKTKDPRMEAEYPQILSTPKPTTFQHYLVQETDYIKKLNHYNEDTVLRGNKLYWHKSGKGWEEKDEKKIKEHETQYPSKIRPVEEGTEFKSHIRFENLLAEELGALLFVLDLPKGCAHKVGMAKPLGLGSVRITPTKLCLSNRQERYKSLFDGENWSLPEKKGKTIQEFKKSFESFVLKGISEKEKDGAGSLWETHRLRQLKVMLDVGHGKELEKKGEIGYMQIEGPNNNEFKDRRVLPLPEKV